MKALFDGPGSYPSSSDPATLGFAGPLSYHNPQRIPDYWQPAQIPAQIPIPISAPPPAAETSPSKRDSDPVIADKVRQASHGHNHQNQLSHAARNASARTQSLDISSLSFSRTLSGSASAFGPMPPSPGAVNGSPNTASGQYFPGQHLRANVTGRGKNGYDSNIDSVTQGEFCIQFKQEMTLIPILRSW